MFRALGAVLIDADAIVHELEAPGTPLVRQLAEVFGPEILDSGDALNREALAAIVFRDPEARERLGKIVHPPVRVEMTNRIASARAAGRELAVVDIPLLFEGMLEGHNTGAALGLEATILVWTPVETQIERTLKRDGCRREAAEQRIGAQMPIDDKQAMADHVIDNSGSLAQTDAQVRAVFEILMARSPDCGGSTSDRRAS
jgi:dephospho-CoA kinase